MPESVNLVEEAKRKCFFMIAEQRDNVGRLRVPSFVNLIREWVSQGNNYHANAARFKCYVEQLGVLDERDRDLEKNGYPKWKHRIDRAAQKVFTDV